MAGRPIVDAGFLVALLSRRDAHRGWAMAQAERFLPPWSTCEAALPEAFISWRPVGPASRPCSAAALSSPRSI
jgi:hypothetical protein